MDVWHVSVVSASSVSPGECKWTALPPLPLPAPAVSVDTLGIFGDISVTAVGFLNINVSSSGAKAWVAAVSDFP